jgi:hypothetical protein
MHGALVLLLIFVGNTLASAIRNPDTHNFVESTTRSIAQVDVDDTTT